MRSITEVDTPAESSVIDIEDLFKDNVCLVCGGLVSTELRHLVIHTQLHLRRGEIHEEEEQDLFGIG